jgi:hypothetical protein
MVRFMFFSLRAARTVLPASSKIVFSGTSEHHGHPTAANPTVPSAGCIRSPESRHGAEPVQQIASVSRTTLNPIEHPTQERAAKETLPAVQRLRSFQIEWTSEHGYGLHSPALRDLAAVYISMVVCR